MITLLLEEIIKELDVEGFDLEYFKSLSSFNKRINYCNDKLERISSGSSRIVYKIDNDKVIKLAKNKKGLAQNEVEFENSTDYMINDLFPKVYDKEENFLWIESQYCKKLNVKRFKEITGLSFKEYSSYLNDSYNRTILHNNTKSIIPDEIWENEYFYTINDYMINYEIPVGDLVRLSSYGETSDGDILLVDNGLTKGVYDNHYK